MRRLLIALTALAMLAIVNVSIAGRERLLAEGRVVLLELAPVDPRSMMQGDYMALRYRVEEQAFPGRRNVKAEDGYIVVTLDDRRVAQFRRVAQAGVAMDGNELRLRYRIRNGKPKFASNAFFFQEGRAAHFAKARYGEFRVAEDGEMILAGLRDRELAPL